MTANDDDKFFLKLIGPPILLFSSAEEAVATPAAGLFGADDAVAIAHSTCPISNRKLDILSARTKMIEKDTKKEQKKNNRR